MTSFTQFLEQRDPELYNQLINEGISDIWQNTKNFFGEFWNRLKSQGKEFQEDAVKIKKAYDEGKLKPKQIEEISVASKKGDWWGVAKILATAGVIGLSALTVGAGHAYAPNDVGTNFKFSPDHDTLIQGEKDVPNDPHATYDVAAIDKNTTDTRKADIDDFQSSVRSANQDDPDDFTAVQSNIDLKSSHSELTSMLPKDIKNYMQGKGITDNVLTTAEKSALNKNVNSLTQYDKNTLRGINNKLSAFHYVSSDQGGKYLAHGFFDAEGKAGHIDQSPDEIYRLNQIK